MANVKIVNLPEITDTSDNDYIVVRNATGTRRTLISWLLKPVRDAIGNLASLTTAHKNTLVGAINELQANSSLQVVTMSSVAGQNYVQAFVPYPAGFTSVNCKVIAMSETTIEGYAVLPYQVSYSSSQVVVTFATYPRTALAGTGSTQVAVLFVKI